ncbi:MAG: arabinose isomerase, partial [Propioniciclava sp.]
MSNRQAFPVQAPAPLERRSHRRPRLALVAGGLGVYWGQFDGLLDALKRSSATIIERLTTLGADVDDFGFISDPAEGQSVAEAVRRSDPDLVICFVSTYMTSAQVLPVFSSAGAPILLVCLQPTASMDHENFGTGDWLAYAGSAGLPEMAVALERLGLPARSVSGHLEDERAWAKIARWVRAAGVVANLRRGRFGLLGHLYPGMFDIATNITSSYATFGGHVEILELDDLRRCYEAVSDADAEARFRVVDEVFAITEGTD